jgi:hypothetical protein
MDKKQRLGLAWYDQQSSCSVFSYKKRIISGRRAKQVLRMSLTSGARVFRRRCLLPLYKRFYALNVGYCPTATETPYTDLQFALCEKELRGSSPRSALSTRGQDSCH